MRKRACPALLFWMILLIPLHGGCPRDDLRLNEILFSPAEENPQFVEIRNSGDAEVALVGVTLVSGDKSYTIPDSITETMGRDSLVLVIFDGKDPAGDDLLAGPRSQG